MTREEQRKEFEQALQEAWERYDCNGRLVDQFEDNYTECAFSKGFKAGYVSALENPTGGALLHVLNKGCKIGYRDAVARTEEFLRYYMGKKLNFLREEDIDAYRKAMTEDEPA